MTFTRGRSINRPTPVHFGITGDVLIPGDYATLQAAFDALGPNQPKPVTVRISAGHALTAGLKLSGGDYSNWTIVSDDATVTLAAGFVGVDGKDAFSENSLFVASECQAPTWSILVNMSDGYGCGIVCEQKADMTISSGDGVINAGAFGIYVSSQSDVAAVNANFSGAGWGNRVTTNSRLTAPQANFGGAKAATYLTVNSVSNLDVSRGSVVYVTGTAAAPTNLSGGLGSGLAVRRSFVSATNVDCSSNGVDGLSASDGAFVAFDGSLASSNARNGISGRGSFVSATSAVAENNTNFNVYAENGGHISARNGSFTGAGANGVVSSNGSKVIVNGANCRMGATDAATDIRTITGSETVAVGATGGTNITPLSLTVNGYIIK